MRITIDNLDGNGAVEYGSEIEFGSEAKIHRALYTPTLCVFSLVLAVSDAVPMQGSRVAIAERDGTQIFTGCISVPPSFEVIGEATSGIVYKVSVAAVSDEAALDTSASPAGTTLIGYGAAQSWNALALRSSDANLPMLVSGQLVNAGRIQIEPGSRWSDAARAVGTGTRSVYRAVAQQVQVASVGNVTHAVSGDDAGLAFDAIGDKDLRWLARDVTVIGAEEPKAYVTELFQGDGITSSFAMTSPHFAPVQGQRTSMADTFQGTGLNPRMWSVADPEGHIALTAKGLSCLGGTGRDAESTVVSLQQIELGGNITIEGTGVQIGAGSVGRVLGLYAGIINAGDCFAGFQVNSVGAGVSIRPLINGAAAGSTFQIVQGRLYTLRLRLSVPDMERVRQTYVFVENTGAASTGGDTVASSGYLQLEVQDTTSGAASAPTVLYSGMVNTLPPACTLALLSSGSLTCSVKGVHCVQAAPLRVTLASGGGNAAPQFLGAASEGGTCRVTAGSNLQFYPSSIPPAGAIISAVYRSRGRSVARRVLAQEAGKGVVPATETWIGSVIEPAAWSSVDCDRAATALLQTAASSSAALKGNWSFKVQSASGDVWPGDMLAIGPLPNGMIAQVVVRNVEISLLGCVPPILGYRVAFANDQAEALSLHLSSKIPLDAVLPEQATGIDTALDSLSALSVSGFTSGSLTIDTGLYAPINGGFEVRRRDDTFGPGTDSDLVLRTSARSITISRTSPVEQFFVRMYDGAVPPNYSLVSAAVLVNLPM